MENIVYYLFCTMCIGGAVGVIVLKDFINTAMSMLVSMLGVAGLMLLMNAYFPAFIMITVYAGAVMVLFVFVVMLVGDEKQERHWSKRMALVVLWAALCVMVGVFAPELVAKAKDLQMLQNGAVSKAQNYGVSILSTFMFPLQITGILLLVAMVGVIVIAKPNATKKVKSDML